MVGGRVRAEAVVVLRIAGERLVAAADDKLFEGLTAMADAVVVTGADCGGNDDNVDGDDDAAVGPQTKISLGKKKNSYIQRPRKGS